MLFSNTYLWAACKIGDLQYVRRAIESCPDQLHLALQGRAPLYHASHCSRVAIVQALLRAGCTARPKFALYCLVYDSPSRRHHHSTAMTSSTSYRCSHDGLRNAGTWPVPLDNRRQGSEMLLSGPVRVQLSLSPQRSVVPVLPQLPSQRIGELVDSVQMECFCGASEIFLPSQPPARFARLVVIPCAVWPDEHPSEPLRKCDPVGCERGAIDSTVVELLMHHQQQHSRVSGRLPGGDGTFRDERVHKTLCGSVLRRTRSVSRKNLRFETRQSHHG
jgi:hypothetical protein